MIKIENSEAFHIIIVEYKLNLRRRSSDNHQKGVWAVQILLVTNSDDWCVQFRSRVNRRSGHRNIHAGLILIFASQSINYHLFVTLWSEGIIFLIGRSHTNIWLISSIPYPRLPWFTHLHQLLSFSHLHKCLYFRHKFWKILIEFFYWSKYQLMWGVLVNFTLNPGASWILFQLCNFKCLFTIQLPFIEWHNN